MKRLVLVLSMAVLATSLNSCKKYKNKEVYANVPVYMDYESFRQSFEYIPAGQPLTMAGNIYVHNNYLLVNDMDKGIHIVDNSDPASPWVSGFMKIPGNTQMSVQGNLLYANSFIDLLVIDLSNINEPQLVTRMKDVFSYCLPVINDKYPVADIHKDQGVVVSWNIEKTKEVSGFMAKMFVADCDECDGEEVQVADMATKAPVTSGGRVNLAGSMAKFAIIGNHLYALDKNEIKSFDISNPSNPSFGGRTKTMAEAETLFPVEHYLFMGTTTGMKIYETQGTEDFPDEVSEIEHVESCDPVVVQGDYAYVTLRSGADCGGVENEFQVIDISNIKWPKFKRSFSMTDPHGLGVDGNLLFICDGEDGLKIYDTSDPLKAGNNLLYHFEFIQTVDIIPNNGTAIMIAEDGVYQYDYSDPGNIYMLSMLNL
ncbi:MAG: hypothetical protein H6582_10345 [Crocinitomicaceae bacterium]|nr:hypothetical protein [Crocinitomicaceae bacterium]